MRRIILFGFLVLLLTSLSAASGLESSGGETPFQSDLRLCPAPGANVGGTAEVPLTTLSSTWQWSFGPESCRDWCGGGCSFQCPASPCPANPAGKPCSPYGAECYVSSGAYFHYYVCW